MVEAREGQALCCIVVIWVRVIVEILLLQFGIGVREVVCPGGLRALTNAGEVVLLEVVVKGLLHAIQPILTSAISIIIA